MEIKIKKEYEVTTKRKIKEGITFRISPSYGCIDILPGLIDVVQVGTEEEINDPTYDFDSWRHLGENPKHWVKYQYQSNKKTNILPLEEFIDHISRA